MQSTMHDLYNQTNNFPRCQLRQVHVHMPCIYKACKHTWCMCSLACTRIDLAFTLRVVSSNEWYFGKQAAAKQFAAASSNLTYY